MKINGVQDIQQREKSDLTDMNIIAVFSMFTLIKGRTRQ